MRIVMDLQACQSGGSRTRGIGRYSLALAQAMVRSAPQHEFWIVLNGHYVEAANAIRKAFDGLIPSARIRLLESPSAIAGMHRTHDWRRESAELMYEAFIDGLEPDVLYFSSFIEGYHEDALTSIGRRARRYIVATTLYDLIPLLNPKPYLEQEDTARWYYRKVGALRQSDLLLAISHSSACEAVGALGLPSQAVINISGAVDDIFSPPLLSDERKDAIRKRYGLYRSFVMYTGGIDHRKNIEGLILAYASLPAEIRDERQLAIICSIHQEDRVRLTKIAREAGLAPDVLICTGYVPEDDLVALYAMCELFVFPSLHEGFGLPALEAMACGAPTIGADNSSIPEVIGNPDALFDARDREAMRDKMMQVLTDDAFRDRLVASGLVQASLFSWERTARRALDAIEQRVPERTLGAEKAPDLLWKPKLAFVSPLPPLETGIAFYSAELLPELARHYDIELISDQKRVSDPWLQDLPLRSLKWFSTHAKRYDRIVYQIGNSHFHADMFALLADHPGTVILHDGYLGHVQIWREHHQQRRDHFARVLVDAHGPGALIDYVAEGPEAAAWRYPCTNEIVRNACGVIVHSHFAAETLSTHLGLAGHREVRVIPHLRALPIIDREQARVRLGLEPSIKLLCSFGGVGVMKRNIDLLDAFLKSEMAADESWRLVFVGANERGAYGAALLDRIQQAALGERIVITGFLAAEDYRAYLAAADGAVQLRSHSRAETSGAVLDCFAFGLPLVVNGHGAMAEIEEGLAIKLPDEFAEVDLIHALNRFCDAGQVLKAMGARARSVIARDHDPQIVAADYRDAIEAFTWHSRKAREGGLLRNAGALATSVAPSPSDLVSLAATIALNFPVARLPALYLDISTLVQVDAKSGVQRVVRELMMALLRSPPAGYRVEPIYASFADEWPVYRYARRFAAGMLGLPNIEIEDEVVDAVNGDIFLGLDLAPHPVTQSVRNGMIGLLRARGVKFHFVVYDILPILRPDLFPDGTYPIFDDWLRAVTQTADGLVCISRSVASEVAQWLCDNGIDREDAPVIHHFPLGSDFTSGLVRGGSATTRAGVPDPLSRAMHSRRSLLMVGTLEPRKGHAQMLDALDQLWARGGDVNLVIVGKRGWLTDDLAERIVAHPEFERRLWWPSDVNDRRLGEIYGDATALLAGSLGEGFGLPLVEAARYGKPAIARDLPVFREIAGASATYFRGEDANDVADVIAAWLQQPSSRSISDASLVTWAQSAEALCNLLVAGPRKKTDGARAREDGDIPQPQAVLA